MSGLGQRLAREASIAAGLAASTASAAAVSTLSAPLAVGFCALVAAGLLTAAALGFLAPALGWPGAALLLGLFWGAVAACVYAAKLRRRAATAFPDPQAAARHAAEGAHLAAMEELAAGRAAPPPPHGASRNAPLSDLELAEMAIRAFRDAAVAGRAMRAGPRRRRGPY